MLRPKKATSLHQLHPWGGTTRESLQKLLLGILIGHWERMVMKDGTKISSLFRTSGWAQNANGGVLFRGDRSVISPPFSTVLLDELHGHPVVETMGWLTQQVSWWPELEADIHTTARNCESSCTKSIRIRKIGIYSHRATSSRSLLAQISVVHCRIDIKDWYR